MPAYALYLESGPQHKKAMAHVLDLLGCVAVGPTIEAALATAPSASTAVFSLATANGRIPMRLLP